MFTQLAELCLTVTLQREVRTRAGARHGGVRALEQSDALEHVGPRLCTSRHLGP